MRPHALCFMNGHPDYIIEEPHPDCDGLWMVVGEYVLGRHNDVYRWECGNVESYEAARSAAMVEAARRRRIIRLQRFLEGDFDLSGMTPSQFFQLEVRRCLARIWLARSYLHDANTGRVIKWQKDALVHHHWAWRRATLSRYTQS